MFYIVIQPKGTPKNVNGLLFGSDDINDYFVCGCETTTEKIDDCFRGKSNVWRKAGRKNSPESFIKQIKKIYKKDGFKYSSELMDFDTIY